LQCSVGGVRRRAVEAVLARLEVIRLCKAAGFRLDEIRVLLTDDDPGRPASRALAEAKLVDIDAKMAALKRAREIIEWAVTCPGAVDGRDCGIDVVSGSPC
jgi:DNA-binding transcriptional MerR regulator